MYAFISMETILLKCFCDYVTLFWRVIPVVRNRCIFWRLKKTIASKQMYLFAQPEVVVSELCPVCFLKPSTRRQGDWSRSWSFVFNLGTLALFCGAVVHGEFRSFIFFAPGISNLLLTFASPVRDLFCCAEFPRFGIILDLIFKWT